ncbi:uncharacterized protein [Littorina saxatilis]|uniref:uncharacterized protein n=1 Tax=Littorina saxatilis TaxID=31220 RepID=UPI0038B5C3B5
MSGGSARGGGRGEESVGSTWTRRVRVYWVPLTRNLRPINILRKMRLDYHDHPALEEIVELDRENQSTRAAEKLLDFMTSQEGLDPDDVTARWSLFDQALREVHPWLHEVVSGTCEADSQESQRRVVNFFMDEICQTVNPEHLIRHFLSLELLGEMECEAVMRITQQKGPTLGAVYMVGHLPRSTNRHWYHDFLHVLMTNGYPELVRILDQSHYEKLLENSRSPDPLSAAPQATAMHERGEAHEDGLQNYAGVPPLSHQTLQSARGTQHGDLVLPASGACAGVKVTTAVTAVPGHEESSKRHVTTGHVYSSDVTANNHDRPEGRWAVSDRRHIYVSVSEYRGETQVHIRHYAGGKAGDDTLRPTKRGIALKLEEWNTLKSLIPHVDHDIKSRDTH